MTHATCQVPDPPLSAAAHPVVSPPYLGTAYSECYQANPVAAVPECKTHARRVNSVSKITAMLHLSAWHKTRHQQFKDHMLLLIFYYYRQQPVAKISHGYVIRKGKDGFLAG